MTTHLLDMTGKTITTYIAFHAAKKLAEMSEGDTLEIRADAFAPIEHDLEAWCTLTGHILRGVQRETDAYTFSVQKGTPPERRQKLALIISNPGLEDLLTPLALAIAAALTGSEVSIIFQGPAVRVLKQGFKGRLKGLSAPFSAFARAAMAKQGHIPPQDKLAQLTELGARFYVCGPSMQHFGVKMDELAFAATPAEYLTFWKVLQEADVRLFLQ